MGSARLTLKKVDYDPSVYLPLKRAAQILGKSEHYIWYTLAKAYKMKRYTNGKSMFFEIEQVRSVKERLAKVTQENGRVRGGAIQKLLNQRVNPVRMNGSGSARVVDDADVPVVEVDVDTMLFLVKKGAVKVKMKQ